MATRYVGSGGSNSNDGLSWANRKLTLNGVEDSPVVAGDIVYIGAGTYRETLTLDVSGGNAYTTGTVSVTNGSAVVTGSGTSWLANAFADGQFQVSQLAHGTDGVTDGSGTFTSAAGNFQAGHVGMSIRINGKGLYNISAVGSPTSITITLPGGGAASPSAGTGLTYDVGAEAPVEILSVDSDTQLTLKRPWSAPSFTGLAYETWRDIKYIGDEDGSHTDGVGGEIRVTGSDNDTSTTRGIGIAWGARNYRTVRGLHFDSHSSRNIQILGATNAIIEQCAFSTTTGGGNGIDVTLSTQLKITIRRCLFRNMGGGALLAQHSATVDNVALVIENCIFTTALFAGQAAVSLPRLGGTLVRNCIFLNCLVGLTQNTAPATGQGTSIYNCLFITCQTGITGISTALVIEDYNNFLNNNAARSNVTAGANSLAQLFYLAQPLISRGVYVPIADAQASYSTFKAKAGMNPPYDDFYGSVRPSPSAWGAVHQDASVYLSPDSGGGAGRLVNGGLVSA